MRISFSDIVNVSANLIDFGEDIDPISITPRLIQELLSASET